MDSAIATAAETGLAADLQTLINKGPVVRHLLALLKHYEAIEIVTTKDITEDSLRQKTKIPASTMVIDGDFNDRTAYIFHSRFQIKVHSTGSFQMYTSNQRTDFSANYIVLRLFRCQLCEENELSCDHQFPCRNCSRARKLCCKAEKDIGGTLGLHIGTATPAPDTERPQCVLKDGGPRPHGGKLDLHVGANMSGPQMPITVVEILVWNPNWIKRRQVAHRIKAAGFTNKDIAAVINWSRNLNGKEGMLMNTITHQILTALDKKGYDPEAAVDPGTAHWEMAKRDRPQYDCQLTEYLHGVQSYAYPRGEDAGPFTQAIMHACSKQPGLLQSSCAMPASLIPPASTQVRDSDKAARDRIMEVVKAWEEFDIDDSTDEVFET